MLRARITRLNGTPVEDATVAPESQWALRSDRGLTYSATPPPGSRLVALVTLAAGVLVLGGAVAAGHRRRVYDAVVLKVLGATRGALAAAFLIEHGLVGLLTALVAAGLGIVAAYALVTGPLKS